MACAARKFELLTYVRVNSSREHPPSGNPGHLMHDESPGTGYLAVNSVPAIWAFANNKKLAS